MRGARLVEGARPASLRGHYREAAGPDSRTLGRRRADERVQASNSGPRGGPALREELLRGVPERKLEMNKPRSPTQIHLHSPACEDKEINRLIRDYIENVVAGLGG